MRPKSLILLLLALGCGLVAAIGINQVLANRTLEVSGDSGEMVPIFVALTDIGMGDPLLPEVLKLEEWPKTKVPSGAATKLEEVEGRRARTKFFGGEPIIEAKLFAKGDQGSGATDLIPHGYRVVSVKVDDVSGSGLILPGDRVDALVHLTENAIGESSRSSTRTFLYNVKVFAVNNVYSRESNGDAAITAKTISLLVTPQQAELVTLANEMGKIRLVMRSADDESQNETSGVTQNQLFKGAESADSHDSVKGTSALVDKLKIVSAAPPPPPKVETPPPAAPASPNAWKMLLIEGNSVREVEFADGSRVGSPEIMRQVNNPAAGQPLAAPPTGAGLLGDQTTPVPPFEPSPQDGP